jgi:hypothetical protein
LTEFVTQARSGEPEVARPQLNVSVELDVKARVEEEATTGMLKVLLPGPVGEGEEELPQFPDPTELLN